MALYGIPGGKQPGTKNEKIFRYAVNEGNRDKAIRVGVEIGLYRFIKDYAADMGTSMSAAVRRLILIGARCEKEHGLARMPASYDMLFYDPEADLREVKGQAILEDWNE